MATKKPLKQLAVRAPFKDLFEIDDEVLASVTEDIKQNGYDAEKPIFAWKRDDEVIVLDGHTRVEAARKARIKEIPVVARQFADEDEAWTFAFTQQANRRNLTKAEIADRLVERAKKSVNGSGSNDSAKVARSLNAGGKSGLRGSTPDPVKAEALKLAKALPEKERPKKRTIERSLTKSKTTAKSKPKIMGWAEGSAKELMEETIQSLREVKLAKVKVYLGEECTDAQIKRLERELDRITKEIAEVRATHETRSH